MLDYVDVENGIIKRKKKVLWSSKKKKISSFYLNLNNIDRDCIQSLFIKNFEIGNTYSMLLRGDFDEGSQYRMLGNQMGFILTQDNYLEVFNNLYDKIVNRIDEFMGYYNIDALDSLQVLFIKVKSLPDLEPKNIKKVIIPKNLVNVKEIQSKYNSKFLPLTVNTDYYGRLISGIECNTYIDKINNHNNIIYEAVDKPDLIYDSMHLYNKYIILSRVVKEGYIERVVYDSNIGTFEGRFLDILVDDITFERRYKNTVFTISNNDIIKISIDKELPILKSESNYKNKYSTASNPFIGSFDLETFEDEDGFAKVYAVGFCILKDKPIKFYLNSSDEDILLKCINEMLVKKYDGYTFYIHNLNYDGVFILNKLNVYNESNNGYYKIQTFYKDSSILKIGVSINKKIHITFVDSSNLLKNKLSVLCESFGLEKVKGHFPYKFVTRDTLHYKGDTPEYHY